MRTVYAIRHGPAFYRFAKPFSHKDVERSRMPWEERKVLEVESILMQVAMTVIEGKRQGGVLTLPLDLLVHIEEGEHRETGDKSLMVHVETIESMERRGYEFEEEDRR